MRRLVNYSKNGLSRLFVLWLQRGKPPRRRKLAIFKADGIGDFVLSSEAIRQLIAKHGPEEVSLIVSIQVYGLAVANFPGVQILPIAPSHAQWRDKIYGLLQLRFAITANTYDEMVCLRHYRTLYEYTILRAFNAMRVVLLSNQSPAGATNELGPIPKNFLCVQPKPEDCSSAAIGIPREWLFHASVLSASLGRNVAPESLRPDWQVHWINREISPPFMLVSPLAGRTIRDLPLHLVKSAARKAFAAGMAKFIITGTRQQHAQLTPYVEALRADLPSCAVEAAHPADLPALVRLVASAALILTAETSAAHIAAALNRPAVVLIGGGHYGWFAPWGRSARQVWLTNRLPCFNCNWQCPYPKPLCLTEITAAEVEAATGEALLQTFLPRPVT